MEKVDQYYDGLDNIGHTRKMQTAFYYYFGKGSRSSYLHTSGLQSQNTEIVVNDFQAIIRHMVTLVTANRPSFDVRATNTDYDSQTQTILGEQILEYYMREKTVEKLLKRACSYAVKYSEGFIGMDWDVKMGNIIGADENGQPINEGDIRYSVYHPLQIIRDIYNDGPQDWVIVRQNINKYELAAKYPEAEDHILNISLDSYNSSAQDLDYLLEGKDKTDTDIIPFYIFYHKKSAVLPEGRIAFFVEGKVLQQGTLPYDSIPVYRVAPDNFDGTCLGYTSAWDLMGIQHASDMLYSSVVSNNLTFGKQLIQTTSDNDINVSDLAEGMMLIESDAELKPVQLTRSAPETYNLIQALGTKQNELSGMNEVVRGTPSPNLRSGNSLAIIAAQAVTFNSGLEGQYNSLIEDVGTATLRMLKDFAVSPKFAAIVGKYKKAFMKSFTGDDLANVDRVTVDLQGSVMRTTAGKVQLAENLLQNGVITRADQYLMVLETGKLDPLIESNQVELLLIRHENEILATGEQPPAVALDSHDLHIVEHRAVIANPEARKNAGVVSATLAHIMEHLDLKRTTSPDLLELVGVKPLQPQQPSGPSPGPMPSPEGGPGVLPEMQPPSIAEGAKMPIMPSLPAGTDAVTQQGYEKLQNIGGVNE
jgi:hypothetical protein